MVAPGHPAANPGGCAHYLTAQYLTAHYLTARTAARPSARLPARLHSTLTAEILNRLPAGGVEEG